MKNEIFAHLDSRGLTELIRSGKLEHIIGFKEESSFPKGSYIYSVGDPSDKVYDIVDGRVKIGNLIDEEKQVTKAVLGRGDIFGEIALVNNKQRREFAYCIEPVSLYELSVGEIQSIIMHYPQAGTYFMKLMGDRMVEMERRLESLVFYDSRTRIIEYIINLMERNGERVGYEFVIRGFLPHKEIANITATSRQTVTTVLNDLRRDEIITFNRKRLLVRNVEKLRAQLNVG